MDALHSTTTSLFKLFQSINVTFSHFKTLLCAFRLLAIRSWLNNFINQSFMIILWYPFQSLSVFFFKLCLDANLNPWPSGWQPSVEYKLSLIINISTRKRNKSYDDVKLIRCLQWSSLPEADQWGLTTSCL